MAWQIEIDEAAKKELGKLDPQVASRVIQFLRTRLQSVKDRLVILVLRVGNRKEIYRR